MKRESTQYFLVGVQKGTKKEMVLGSAPSVMDLESILMKAEIKYTLESTRIVKGSILPSPSVRELVTKTPKERPLEFSR